MTAIDDLVKKIAEGDRTVFDLSEKGSLKVTLQRLAPEIPPEPARAETPRAEHAFYEAAGFAAYLARYGVAGGVVVYADPGSETAWGTLDEAAKGGVETLTFKPQLSPLWAPWAQLATTGRVPLDVFRAFLAANRRVVKTPSGAALGHMLAQLRGARDVTIHDGRGNNALNGVVVKTLIQGVSGTDAVAIPEEIVLRVPLYVGGQAQDVPLDLVLDVTSDNKVTVMIATGSVNEARVLAFEGMLATIRGMLKDFGLVTYGRPARGSWDYRGDVE